MSNTRLNIFQLLGSLNRGDLQAYGKLSDDEQKQAHPLVLMRWMSGSMDAQQLMMLNTFVNPYVFSLYRDKELMMKLLAVCGNRSRASWIKGPSVANKTSKPQTVKLLAEKFNCSHKRALEKLEFIDGEWTIALAQEQGWQDKEVAALAKEWGMKGHRAPKGSKTARQTIVEVDETVSPRVGVSDAVEF